MGKQVKSILWQVAVIGFILLILGIVGRFDYEDELRAAQMYCDNVGEGVWPDYKGIYEKECK